MGVWVARYLGPEQFGLLNYATAFVALFGAIATLGFNSIVVRDLVKEPENANATLGTAFVLQVIGALVAIGLIVSVITWLRPEDEKTKVMVIILGFTLLFQSSEVIKYWFESVVQSRYTVWIENGVFLVMATVKVGLILSHATLITFVWMVLAEAILVAVGLFVIYIKQVNALRHWQLSLSRAKTLLHDSWPLILSGLTIMIYMKIDQVMLGQMRGNEEVGIYSVAARISEVWYFVPGIILASTFPSIVTINTANPRLAKERWQNLYTTMMWLSLSVAIFTTFTSKIIIEVLFGDEYLRASSVLTIHIWAGVNVAIGSVWSKWLLLENKLRIAFYGSLLGALINVLLNYILIAKYGANGAAIATLLSYWISALLVYSFHKPLVTYKFIINSLIPIRKLRWI